MSIVFKKVLPLFDRVLIERLLPETRTKGGVLIPETNTKAVTGRVVAVGKGARTEDGNHIPVTLQPGDHVLLPDYGGTKVVFEEKELTLYRESELLAKLE